MEPPVKKPRVESDGTEITLPLIDTFTPKFTGGGRTLKVYGTFQEPYFYAKDLAQVFGIDSERVAEFCRKTLKQEAICDPVNGRVTYFVQKRTWVAKKETTGRQRKTQEVWTLSEGGLYAFFCQCRIPAVIPFKQWVFTEVLPSIRKTGAFIANPVQQESLREKNKELRKALDAQSKKTFEDVLQFKVEKAKSEQEIADLQLQIKSNNEQLSKMQSELKVSVKDGTNSLKELVVLQTRNDTLNAEILLKRDDLVSLEEDIRIRESYLCNCVSKVVDDTTPKDTTRDSKVQLRLFTYVVFHMAAFMIVTQYKHVHGNTPSVYVVQNAIRRIMHLAPESIIPILGAHCGNPIRLYTFMSGMAKQTHELGKRYSTQMTLEHLYCYSSNINDWASEVLGMENVCSYVSEFKEIYGEERCASFSLGDEAFVKPTDPPISNYFTKSAK